MRGGADFSIGSRIIVRATAEIIATIQDIAVIWHSRVDERIVYGRKGKAGVIGAKLTSWPATRSLARVKAEHLIGGQENEKNVGGRRYPTGRCHSDLNFFLDIAIKHGV